ncbi:MAG: hypothetical protein ACJA1I_000433 [Zhongshania marina]|jgi:hypothetical protein
MKWNSSLDKMAAHYTPALSVKAVTDQFIFTRNNYYHNKAQKFAAWA